MGYSLSTLAKLPFDKENEFYIFILGGNANWTGGVLQTVYDNFDALAKEIGPNAIIAKGLNPREWTMEISNKYFGDCNQIHNLLPGILITNTHPDKFNNDSMRILLSLEKVEENFSNTEQFFNLLTDFIKDKDKRFIEFAEKNIDWLKTINDTIDLKPNFFGLGVNLNALIALYIKSRES